MQSELGESCVCVCLRMIQSTIDLLLSVTNRNVSIYLCIKNYVQFRNKKKKWEPKLTGSSVHIFPSIPSAAVKFDTATL